MFVGGPAPLWAISGAVIFGPVSDLTHLLNAAERGDPQVAEQLLPLVYDELRKLAAQKLAQEKPGQTLQATALVHEVYLRLVAKGASEDQAPQWNSRGADQPEIGLVDQGRRLEGLAGRLLGQPLRRQLAQLVVDQGQQFLGGVGIALVEGGQEVADFVHGRHCGDSVPL